MLVKLEAASAECAASMSAFIERVEQRR